LNVQSFNQLYMVHLSKKTIDKNKLAKLYRILFEITSVADDENEYIEIIKDIISPSEQIMIAKRIAIIFLLIKNIEFQNICQVLKVSSSTVSKFSLLKEKESPIIKNLQGFIIKDEFYDFFLDFLNTLFPPGKYGVNWKDAWERKKESQRRKTYGF